MDFFSHQDISGTQAEALARGLYTIARVDGVHEREASLIAQLYAESAGGAGTGLSELQRSADVDGAYLAATLPGKDLREMFVKTAWLLAYADGGVSDAERKKIAELCGPLGVDAAAQARLEGAVKDFLLAQLSGLSNTEAVAKVARKLGV